MIQLPDGGSIKYEKCLLATGAKPFARFAGDWQLGDQVTTYRNVRTLQLFGAIWAGKQIAYTWCNPPILTLAHCSLKTSRHSTAQ